MKGLAERRAGDERIKARTRRLAREQFHSEDLAQNPKWVGMTAAMHCTCACGRCSGEAAHRKPSFEKRRPTELYL